MTVERCWCGMCHRSRICFPLGVMCLYYKDFVLSFAFSPDEKYFVSGSEDETFRIPDSQTETILIRNTKTAVIISCPLATESIRVGTYSRT
jgi:WD40 repeat protein